MLLFTVENLAYRKEAWINSQRHYKRHIRNRIVQGHAARAVDGKIELNLASCTILDNLYGDNPIWTVDIGANTPVSGIVIYTWQGQGRDAPTTASPTPSAVAEAGSSEFYTIFHYSNETNLYQKEWKTPLSKVKGPNNKYLSIIILLKIYESMNYPKQLRYLIIRVSYNYF